MAYLSAIHILYCGKVELGKTKNVHMSKSNLKPLIKRYNHSFQLCKDRVKLYFSTFYGDKKRFLSAFFYDRLYPR